MSPSTSSVRPLLSTDAIAPEALEAIAHFHTEVVEQVKAEVATNEIVVVGMKQNQVVAKARKALDEIGVPYTYLEYGSYLSEWKKRLAIKLWSGWPTFPQVFVGGKLLGGAAELERAIKAGKIKVS